MQYRKNIKNLIGQLAVNTKPAHKNGKKKKERHKAICFGPITTENFTFMAQFAEDSKNIFSGL